LTVLLAMVAVVAVGLLVRQWLMSDQTGATADGAGQTVDTAGRDNTDSSDTDSSNSGRGERPNAIAVDGEPVTVDSPAGQNARLTFAGEEGQYLSLGAMSSSLNPATIDIVAPNGETVDSIIIYATTGDDFYDLDLAEPLSQAGEYTIVVDPDVADGNVTLALTSS
jgi:hypothetical protein